VLSVLQIGPKVRNQRTVQVIARMTNGATLESVRSEMGIIAARLATTYPTINGGWSVTAIPLQNAIVGDVGRALVIVLAVVGAILLMCCVNLANMLLARGPGRSREIAIRTALGASRTRIVQQLLTETLTLALLGAMLGLLLSIWVVPAVLALSAHTIPRVEDVHIDSHVVGFAFLLAVGTGVLFGLIPALQASRANPQVYLQGGRGTVGRGQKLHSALVVAEVAIAVVLVIAAGLMARSFLELRTVNPGFDPERSLAVTMQVNLTGVTRPIPHIVQRREEWIARLSRIPGVVSVGSITSLPLRFVAG
jgi:putative ABC transport system permease protein